MKKIIFLSCISISLLICIQCTSQKNEKNSKKSESATTVKDYKNKTWSQYMGPNMNGKVESELYKHLTARTWVFTNGEIFLEFFNCSGLVFKNKKDFQICNQIKFQKDKIDFLKETVSYLHEENFEDAIEKSTELNEVQINIQESLKKKAKGSKK